LNGLSAIGLFFIPESPEYLYSFYRFRECREVIEKIAKWNGRVRELNDFKNTQIEVLKKS
jgi:Sugar (and other) transporter